MQLPVAVEALSALAHASRLAVFRLLVRAGADGLPAGEIAREVGALPNTLSTHLTILGHAGLIQSRRDGRSVIYSANYDGMRDLLGFPRRRTVAPAVRRYARRSPEWRRTPAVVLK